VEGRIEGLDTVGGQEQDTLVVLEKSESSRKK
jgi:hypothetical protein